MRCRAISARLAVLRPEEAALELAEHLGGCASCRELLEAERSTWAALGGLEVPPLRGDLWPGVAARIDENPASFSAASGFTRWLATPVRYAATTALMALLGLAAGTWVGGELLDDRRTGTAGVLDEALSDAFSVAPKGSLAAGLEEVGR